MDTKHRRSESVLSRLHKHAGSLPPFARLKITMAQSVPRGHSCTEIPNMPRRRKVMHVVPGLWLEGILLWPELTLKPKFIDKLHKTDFMIAD